MKFISRSTSFGLAAAFTMATIAPLRADLQLPLIYTNNMVLQQGEVTVFYGRAAPKAKVTGFFRGKKFDSVTAQADGEWELQLNLRNAKEVSPAALKLVEETRDRQASEVVLANVVVGRVWWLGVYDGRDPNRGMPASLAAISGIVESAWDRIRFAALDGGSWVSLARQGETTNRIDSFALAAARNLVATNGYVGIVQTSRENIDRFGPERSPRSDPGGFRLEVNSWLQTALGRVNREVATVLSTHQQLLIAAKHQGVVTNLSLPTPYSISTVRRHDEFAPANPELGAFLSRYSFEGAIW